MAKIFARVLVSTVLMVAASVAGQKREIVAADDTALQFEVAFHQHPVPILGLTEAAKAGSIIVGQKDYAFLTTDGIFGFAIHDMEGRGQHKLLTVCRRSESPGMFESQFGWPLAPNCALFVPGALAQLQQMRHTEELTLEIDNRVVLPEHIRVWNSWPDGDEVKVHLKSGRFPEKAVWILKNFKTLIAQARVPTDISLHIALGNPNQLVEVATWHISNPRPIHPSVLSRRIFGEGLIPASLSGPKEWKFAKVLDLFSGKRISSKSNHEPISLATLSGNLLYSSAELRRKFQWIPRYWPLLVGGVGLGASLFCIFLRKYRNS